MLANGDQFWDRVIIESLLIRLGPHSINQDSCLSLSNSLRPLLSCLDSLGRLIDSAKSLPGVKEGCVFKLCVSYFYLIPPDEDDGFRGH